MFFFVFFFSFSLARSGLLDSSSSGSSRRVLNTATATATTTELELPDPLQQLPSRHVRPEPHPSQQRQLEPRELRGRDAADAGDESIFDAMIGLQNESKGAPREEEEARYKGERL